MLAHPHIHRPTEQQLMSPASVLLAAPGFAVLVAGSATRDVGLQVIGAVLTAVTLGAMAFTARAITKAVGARNEEVTRRVVKEEMQAALGGLRAELHGQAQDIDRVAGEVSAAQRRIDGLMQREGPPRPP